VLEDHHPVAGLRLDGIAAPFVSTGRSAGAFRPALARARARAPAGDIVIMDNLQPRGPRGRADQGRLARLLYLPPYSPDFNPIENAFAKLKALLRKAAERTIDGLWRAIGRLIDRITPKDCGNFFTSAGYEPE
jgi:transposase